MQAFEYSENLGNTRRRWWNLEEFGRVPRRVQARGYVNEGNERREAVSESCVRSAEDSRYALPVESRLGLDRRSEAIMKASVLAITILLAGCANGLMLSDALVTLDPRTTASDPTTTTSTSHAPSHVMVHSVRELGTISMELKHGNPSEEQWAKADSDAYGKCREWGYEEAEVTGTRHHEFLGESNRRYQCRGRISASIPQAPSHIMVDSFRELGTISMELKHGNPSEGQWAKADNDAHGKCREWGYEEAEVTGTRHYEFLGESSRDYRCRGRETTRNDDYEPGAAVEGMRKLLLEMDDAGRNPCSSNIYFTKDPNLGWSIAAPGALSIPLIAVSQPGNDNLNVGLINLVRSLEEIGAGDDVAMTTLARFSGVDC